jgi:heat shock protein HslJ
LALALAWGCGEGAPRDEGGEAYRADRRLEGAWTIVTVEGAAVNPVQINRAKAGVAFRQGLVTWSIGCNIHDAGYRTEGDRLVVLPRTSTAMACNHPQERLMETVLDRDRPRFRLQDDLLILETEPGPLVLRRTGR